MDPQVRNFRDFLSLYNKITHLCFSHCIDNFFSREVSQEESACVDKCLQKFTRVNQRVMNVYVEVQTAINARRIAELEAQQQEQAKLLEAQQQQQANLLAPEILTPIEKNLTQFSSSPSEVEYAR